MKILKLLVTSMLMSAMLISCSGEDTAPATTETTPTTTETTAPEATPEVEATEEVETESTETEATSYFHADMTDEEITEAYTQQLNDMLEAGEIEEEAIEVMLSIFDPATVRATLAGEEIDVDALVESLEEAIEGEETTE